MFLEGKFLQPSIGNVTSVSLITPPLLSSYHFPPSIFGSTLMIPTLKETRSTSSFFSLSFSNHDTPTIVSVPQRNNHLELSSILHLEYLLHSKRFHCCPYFGKYSVKRLCCFILQLAIYRLTYQ